MTIWTFYKHAMAINTYIIRFNYQQYHQNNSRHLYCPNNTPTNQPYYTTRRIPIPKTTKTMEKLPLHQSPHPKSHQYYYTCIELVQSPFNKITCIHKDIQILLLVVPNHPHQEWLTHNSNFRNNTNINAKKNQIH